MSVTIKDIAKECNCSITSVSFVLNGKSDFVGKETAERILATCKKYNYKPNYIAAALKNKTTKTAGILIPDIENSYYARIIKCLENLLKEKGYSLIFADSGYNFDQFEKNVIDITNRSIDYLIIVPPSLFQEVDEEKINDVAKMITVPYVILDRKISFGDCPIIINDDIKGGYLATKYLLDLGHKKIACITGPKNISSSLERLKGYKKALKEAHIPFDSSLLVEGNYRFEGSINAAKDIVLNKKADAIFAFNDLSAYAVYKIANDNDIKIGEDLSLVGFDDNQFSALISPGLTSVKQNIEGLCKAVIKKLMSDNKANNTTKIEPTITIRGSVKNVKS